MSTYKVNDNVKVMKDNACSAGVMAGSLGVVVEAHPIEDSAAWAYKVRFINGKEWAFNESDLAPADINADFNEIVQGEVWLEEAEPIILGGYSEGCPGDSIPHVHLEDTKVFILPSIRITDEDEDSILAVDVGGLVKMAEKGIALNLRIDSPSIGSFLEVNLSQREAVTLGFWLLDQFGEEEGDEDDEDL